MKKIIISFLIIILLIGGILKNQINNYQKPKELDTKLPINTSFSSSNASTFISQEFLIPKNYSTKLKIKVKNNSNTENNLTLYKVLLFNNTKKVGNFSINRHKELEEEFDVNKLNRYYILITNNDGTPLNFYLEIK